MSLTIKKIDKKMNDIENYYSKFNMCSYEYDLEDKMYLGRLYNLKLKLTTYLKIKPQSHQIYFYKQNIYTQ